MGFLARRPRTANPPRHWRAVVHREGCRYVNDRAVFLLTVHLESHKTSPPATSSVPSAPATLPVKPKPAATGYWQLVREQRDFRWLWFGQIVSLLGDWFNLIASVALVASLTNSGLAIGGVFVLRMLAPFFTSPIAGVFADRFDRRLVLIVSDVARGMIVLGMLFVRGPETVWLLYVLTALQMGSSSFFFTARTAILPDLVPERAVGTANAVTSATWSVMLSIGAALGGLTAGWLGVYTAFVIDAVSFFLSAALVARIRFRSQHHGQPLGSLSSGLQNYWEGLAYLRQHRDIFVITLHKAALTMLLGTTFRVVQASVAKEIFPMGREAGLSMGLMFALAGIGTGLGPLAMRFLTGDDEWRLRWAIVSGYLLGGLGLAISATLLNFPTMLWGAFLAGAGNGILWVFSTQLLLQCVAPEVRGRVFGTEFAMFALASATGSAVVGFALDTSLETASILSVMAWLALPPAVAWCLWLLGLRRALRTDEVNPNAVR